MINTSDKNFMHSYWWFWIDDTSCGLKVRKKDQGGLLETTPTRAQKKNACWFNKHVSFYYLASPLLELSPTSTRCCYFSLYCLYNNFAANYLKMADINFDYHPQFFTATIWIVDVLYGLRFEKRSWCLLETTPKRAKRENTDVSSLKSWIRNLNHLTFDLMLLT